MKTLELVKKICTYSEKELLNNVSFVLSKYYKEKRIIKTDDYFIAKGNIPVAIMAHADTVFSVPPSEFFYDQEQKVLWSPDGLGADDRAGIAAILSIVSEGLRPHIIITTKEEKGGIGAQTLIHDHYTSPFRDLKYIIELDRRGKKDCVFYNCDNPKFTEYVEGFGFTKNYGTFTDISVICPVWGVAGVNLSVGYDDEHSKAEHLYIEALERTILKVIKMLKSANRAPHFKYIKGYSNALGGYDFSYYTSLSNGVEKYYENEFMMPCESCGIDVDYTDLVTVKDGLYEYDLCYKCFSELKDVVLCPQCNEWYLEREGKNMCEECEEKIKNGNNNGRKSFAC